jgi:hypothetical protein
MRRIGFLVLLAVAAMPRAAAPHVVPIPPSTCAFDPLALSVPGTASTGAAAAPTTADMVRTVYDAASSEIQFCPAVADPNQCGSPVPRAFTLGTTSGTLTFPDVFAGNMLSSGDVTIDALPVTVTVGASTTTAPITFTTGLVDVAGTVLEGVPLQGLQSYTLVGVAAGDALPPPLAGQPLVLTMSCEPRPVPDKDQFALVPTFGKIGGRIMQGKSKLRTTAELFSSSPPDFATHPSMLVLHADGQPIASALFSSGLQGTKRLTATSDDGGATLTLKQTSGPQSVVTGTRSATGTKFVVMIRFSNVALPPQTGGGRVLIDLTLDTAGILGRGEQLFHASHNGKKLHP